MATTSVDTKEAEPKKEDEEKSFNKDTASLTNPSPRVELRSNLIDLAVKFLSNPKVISSPMDQKRAFLKKKGLSDAEITQAIQLAGVSSPSNNQIVPNQAPPLPVRTLNPAPTTWREYALIAAVVGGVGYALYHFIKSHVIPWFQQRRRQEERLADIQSSVEQLETNIRDMVTSVNDSTKALRDLLSEQQGHLQLLSSQVTALQTSVGQTGSSSSLRDVKDEVSSLKGLLLNRHQFPPTPSRTNSQSSGIPQWQRAQATPTKTSEPTSEGSSNNSSPETAGKNGLVNGVEESGDELALVNGRGGSKEESSDWLTSC